MAASPEPAPRRARPIASEASGTRLSENDER